MKLEKIIRNKRIAIDFDGVLQAKNNEIKNFICLDEPVEGAKEALIKLKNKGYKIIIYTARPWFLKQWVKFWLKYYGMPFDKIICGKPICMYYVDDNAIEFKNWKQTMKKIK